MGARVLVSARILVGAGCVGETLTEAPVGAGVLAGTGVLLGAGAFVNAGGVQAASRTNSRLKQQIARMVLFIVLFYRQSVLLSNWRRSKIILILDGRPVQMVPRFTGAPKANEQPQILRVCGCSFREKEANL